MRIAIKLILLVTALIALPITLVGVWYILEISKDPVDEIALRYSELKSLSQSIDTVNNPGEARVYHDVDLMAQNSDTTRITVSIPDPLPEVRLPVIVVLGGLEAGRKSLGYIPRHGNNILVSYQYPFKPSYFDDGAYFSGFQHIRNTILKTPAQVCMALKWLEEQTWADQEKIILLGYSLGALAIPAAQRLAQLHDIQIRASAFCYGGVDYDELILHNFQDRVPGVNPITAKIGAALIHPLEPRLHIQELKGEFLVVNGKLDNRIPFAKALEFQALVPEPKTIINLNEGHMHPGKPELTRKLIEISGIWLVERGLVNQ